MKVEKLLQIKRVETWFRIKADLEAMGYMFVPDSEGDEWGIFVELAEEFMNEVEKCGIIDI